MKLYLVRHTHAVSDAENPVRPLSPKGREVALGMGRWLRGNAAADITEVWHSPLVRARETAELLVEGARLKVRLREAAGLLPEDEVSAMATALGRHGDSLVIVGHEPHLGLLAGRLLGIEVGGVDFKKGAVLCLERILRGAPWTLLWHVSPRLVLGQE
ncbi:MAG: phosphohistidine phosphatase SixA [Opitutaceae bacterium]|nr:phosphohistidine phosphatase SixA [Opitutaceae bacterium]